MPWKNKSSLGIIVILLAVVGLVLGTGSGLAQLTSEKTPILISLDVTQMDLQDVLRLIAEKANVNIIAGREVAGAVTLRLKNVDLWQALEAVLEASGFTYREEEGIIRVVKAKELGEVKTPLLETKIIFLKFAKAEDVKKAFQHLLSASGTMEIDPTSKALIVTDIPEDIENIKKRVAELEEAAREKIELEETLRKKMELEEALREKIEKEELPPPELEKRFQLNYINVEEKKEILTESLGNIIGEEGKFFLDSLTNSVYVTAPSSSMERVKGYFEGLDVPPKRIMIKAEFVEVRLSALKELGIRWRWMGAYDNYPLGATFRYPYYVRPEPGETAGSAEALSTLATGMGIIFGSAEQEFRGIIDLLISEGEAHLLSSPNIVTLEGEEAKIDVGDKHPYRVTKYIEGVWVETIEFVTIGAKLVVTPHIKGEKKVVLTIHPEVSEFTGAPPFPGAPPIVGMRETETRIMVDDGETIVVGGLLRETESKTTQGIPLLSRLPILGSLFRRTEIVTEQTDLLVFITPYILPEKLEEEDIIEKRKPLSIQIEEIYQKGLDYKKDGEYEKARGRFEELIKKSRIYGFSDYLRYGEKELVEVEGLEKERLEKEKEEEARLEKARLEKERIERKTLVKEIYQKGLDYKKAGEYEKARGRFEEVIKKSRIYGFSDYLRYGEKELARVERLEKVRLAKEEEEKARLEKERLEKERIEKKRLEKEKEEEARLEKARLEKQRLERKTLVKEIYQKGLDYKKDGEYEKARGRFEELIKKSQTYGFSNYLRYGERELTKVEGLEKARLEKEKQEEARLEKERLAKEEREKASLEKERIKKARLEEEKPEKETILTLGLGKWFPSRDNDSFMIYEAQLRLKGNLRFFAGGGESSDEPSYIGYYGVRIGDKLNVGVGGMNSSALEKPELMFTGGFSLGGDRVRLEGNYLWVPENEDANGIKAILGIRF